MTETIQTIYNRYSCRDYLEKMVSHDILDTILQAGLQAPSSMNRQECIMTAITNQTLLEELKVAVCRALRAKPGYSCFYNAPVIVIISAPKEYSALMQDGSCILENIFLAATSMHIATCWVNQVHGVEDEPEVRSVLSRCQVPADHSICGCAILGYAATLGNPKEKRSHRIKYVE